MIFKYKDREIEVTEFEIDYGEGAYVLAANYTDGKQEDLTEAEIEEVEQLHQSEIYQNAYEHAAAAAYDRAKDAWKYGD